MNKIAKAIGMLFSMKRIFVGALSVPVFIVLVYGDNLVFTIIASFFIVLCLFEYFALAKAKGINCHRISALASGIILCFSIYIGSQENANSAYGINLLLFISIAVAVMAPLIYRIVMSRIDNAIRDISATLFGVIYVAGGISSTVAIKCISVDGDKSGWAYIFILIIVIWVSDMVAYALGNMFGRYQLSPEISPKKTVEGAIGGLLAGILVSIGIWFFVFRNNPYVTYTFFDCFLIGLLLGVVGQVGDLAESLMKRDANIKDSGKMLLGHGGVLDAIDSILFSAPVLFVFLKFTQ